MIPQLLIPRFWKWVGLTLYIVSFIYGMQYSYDIDDVNYIMGLYIQICIFIGLILMILARLQIEDELTAYYRLTSWQWAILLFIAYRLIMKCMAFYYHDTKLLPRAQVNFLLLLYLFLFYSQVRLIPFLKSIWNINEK